MDQTFKDTGCRIESGMTGFGSLVLGRTWEFSKPVRAKAGVDAHTRRAGF